jgi:hypothetical protein
MPFLLLLGYCHIVSANKGEKILGMMYLMVMNIDSECWNILSAAVDGLIIIV